MAFWFAAAQALGPAGFGAFLARLLAVTGLTSALAVGHVVLGSAEVNGDDVVCLGRGADAPAGQAELALVLVSGEDRCTPPLVCSCACACLAC